MYHKTPAAGGFSGLRAAVPLLVTAGIWRFVRWRKRGGRPRSIHRPDLAFNRPLSKPCKGIRFLEFVSLPPPRPSPTGEGAVLRQIQITAAISHMDSYETVAIFAANEFPPPCGGGLGWGQQTTARQVWNFVGLPCKLWFGRKSNKGGFRRIQAIFPVKLAVNIGNGL